jgi:hypothetical protein
MQATPPAAVPAARPRFSWPVRLLVGFLVFDIVFHSVTALTGYREWMEDKKMDRFPRRMPNWYEIQHPDKDAPPGEEAWRSADSLWEYFHPWPDRTVRANLKEPYEYAMFYLAWMASRLDFFESVIGVPQRWTMFSPSTATRCSVARFRLVYADDTIEIVRITGDPVDLTKYTHWFEEKLLDAELKVPYDYDSRLGYCNYLAHEHAKNRAGAPLRTIYIYKVRYYYPEPGEDITAAFSVQNGPPDWDRDGPTWSYDPVKTEDEPHGQLRKIDDDQRLRIRDRLDQLSSRER